MGAYTPIDNSNSTHSHMIFVDPEDRKTILQLTEEIARCFDEEKVRLLYFSAQVTRMDLKVDMVIAETMWLYKHIIQSALGASAISGGPFTTVLRCQQQSVHPLLRAWEFRR